MSLPPEKRAELRQVIHDQLNNVSITVYCYYYYFCYYYYYYYTVKVYLK